MTEPTTIVGPACTLDVDILRAWLAQPVTGGSEGVATLAEDMGLDEVETMSTEDVTSSLQAVLNALDDDDEQDALIVHDAVERIDPRLSGDGVIVLVDLRNGLRLASLEQEHKALTRRAENGVDAVVNTVVRVATEANDLVRKYHEVSGAGAEVTGREVSIRLAGEEHLAPLGEAMGLRPGAINAVVQRNQVGEVVGVRIDRQYNLDAAVAYAREHGLRFVEDRETTYDSGA